MNTAFWSSLVVKICTVLSGAGPDPDDILRTPADVPVDVRLLKP